MGRHQRWPPLPGPQASRAPSPARRLSSQFPGRRRGRPQPRHRGFPRGPPAPGCRWPAWPPSPAHGCGAGARVPPEAGPCGSRGGGPSWAGSVLGGTVLDAVLSDGGGAGPRGCGGHRGAPGSGAEPHPEGLRHAHSSPAGRPGGGRSAPQLTATRPSPEGPASRRGPQRSGRAGQQALRGHSGGTRGRSRSPAPRGVGGPQTPALGWGRRVLEARGSGQGAWGGMGPVGPHTKPRSPAWGPGLGPQPLTHRPWVCPPGLTQAHGDP